MIKCVNRWLILKPNRAETLTQGGIIIPDVEVERNDRGVIVEIAPAWSNSEGETQPTLMAIGEEVLYNKDRGTEIIEKDILEAYNISQDEELIYLMYDDLYFVTKSNKEGERKRKEYAKQHGI